MAALMEREPIAATELEQPALGKLENALSKINLKAKLVSPEGEEIELPDSVFRFLRQLVYYLLRGQAVSVVPINREMTTQEAADLLNVSRPFLISLLQKGEISFKMVGTHRRINFDNLIEYKRKRDQERKQGLDKLTQLSQDEGHY